MSQCHISTGCDPKWFHQMCRDMECGCVSSNHAWHCHLYDGYTLCAVVEIMRCRLIKCLTLADWQWFHSFRHMCISFSLCSSLPCSQPFIFLHFHCSYSFFADVVFFSSKLQLQNWCQSEKMSRNCWALKNCRWLFVFLHYLLFITNKMIVKIVMTVADDHW